MIAPDSGRGQDKGIPVRVAELGIRAPRLRGWRHAELYAALAQLAVGGFDVVACKGAVEEGADPVLLAIGGEQHDARAGMRDAQLDPALARSHRLVGGD